MRWVLGLTAATLALCIGAGSAAAQNTTAPNLGTAGGLAEACLSRDEGDRNFCHGMLYGTVQAAAQFRDMRRRGGERVLPPEANVLCPPSRVSLTEMRDGYVRWVRSHNVARMSAGQAAFNAMADLYPCGRGRDFFDDSLFGRGPFGDGDDSFIPRVGD
jgi:hypothetical protein